MLVLFTNMFLLQIKQNFVKCLNLFFRIGKQKRDCSVWQLAVGQNNRTSSSFVPSCHLHVHSTVNVLVEV